MHFNIESEKFMWVLEGIFSSNMNKVHVNILSIELHIFDQKFIPYHRHPALINLKSRGPRIS